MKTNKIIGLLVAVAAMMTFAANAWAAGTLAGTVITNQATVTYQNNTGVTTFTQTSNQVSTTVQQVAAVTVTSNSGNVTVQPGSQAVNWFVITNNGNNADKFNFAAPTLGGTLAASATLVGVYVNPVGTASSTTFAGTATATQLVLGAASAGVYQTPFINTSAPASTGAGLYPQGTVVFVVYSMPNNAVNGDTLTKITTVSSNFDATKTSVTTVAGVNMNDTITAGFLNVTKQVRNFTTNPAGAFASTAVGVPGNILEYQITVTNNGTGIAQVIQMQDNLDANTTWVAGSVTKTAGIGLATEATTSAPTTAPLYTLRVNLGTGATAVAGGSLNATESITFTFRVTIQ